MAGVMIDSPLYDTGRRLIQRSILQQKDSAQYDTALSQSRKTGITWRNLNQNWKYFNPLLSGPGRFELKKTRQKSCWNVPLNRIPVLKSPMTPRSMILQGDWLCVVWYCGEIDSGHYDTEVRLTIRSIILRGE